jgi:uncharacterized protein (DUF1501 family)
MLMASPLSSRGCTEFLACQRLTRRELLRVGSLSALGLSLPALLASEARTPAAPEGRARARSCILVFLAGGPSQHETFDPKPDAPSDIKSIFGTTATAVPGTHLCEHLPDLAPLATRFALVRSLWHKQGGHFGGQRYALSGTVAPGQPDQQARTDDKPGLIGLAGKYLSAQGSLPATVMLPWPTTDQGSGVSGGMGGGTLGRQYDPLLVEVNKALAEPRKRGAERVPSPAFLVPAFALQPGVTGERFEARRGLLEQMEAQRRTLLSTAATTEMEDHYRRAYNLLASTRIQAAFDVEQEEARTRERYGLEAFGQSCLLARRLVEGGARFVQVNFARFVTQTGYGWDTHGKGRETLKDQLLPRLNRGLSSLLNDLAERGLLEQTLVVVMGEFGRTPRVKSDGGRDHWPGCYSALLAGGGIHGGLVYGKSDRNGAKPAAEPVEARCLLATVLTLLGIPTVVTDALGRVTPLLEGAEPVQRLYA